MSSEISHIKYNHRNRHPTLLILRLPENQFSADCYLSTICHDKKIWIIDYFFFFSRYDSVVRLSTGRRRTWDQIYRCQKNIQPFRSRPHVCKDWNKNWTMSSELRAPQARRGLQQHPEFSYISSRFVDTNVRLLPATNSKNVRACAKPHFYIIRIAAGEQQDIYSRTQS